MKKIAGILTLLLFAGVSVVNAETTEREVKVKPAPIPSTTQTQGREVQIRSVSVRPAVIPEKIQAPVAAAVKTEAKKISPSPESPKVRAEGQKSFFQGLMDQWFPKSNSQAQ